MPQRDAPLVRANLPDILTAIAVCILATLAYGAWRGAAYSGDDLQYASLVREAVTGSPSFHPAGARFIDPLTLDPQRQGPSPRWVANPRYPLDTLAAIGWARVRGDEDPIAAVQAFRALCGGLALTFAFLGLRRLAVARSIAVVTTMSLAVSHAFWEASTRVDYAITAVLLVALTIFLYARWLSDPKGAPPPVGMVVSLAAAALCNLLALLPAMALLAAGFVAAPTRRRLVTALGRVALLFLLVGGAVAGFWVLVPTGVSDAPFWRDVTQGGVGLGNFQPLRDVGRGAAGLARAFLALPGLGDEPHSEFWRTAGVSQRAWLAASYVGLWVAALALLAAPWLLRGGLGAKRPASIALVVSFVTLSAFNWAWEPGHLKFWVLPLTLWWLLLALVLDSIRRKRETTRWTLAVAALGVTLGAVNWVGHFRPAADPSRQPWLMAARQLSATPRSTLFLSAGHPADFHITYFARRNVVATELVRYDAAIRGRTDAAVTIGEHVRRHRAAGGPILLLEATGLDASSRYCWPQLMARAGGTSWTGFGLAARELRLPDGETVDGPLCR